VLTAHISTSNIVFIHIKGFTRKGKRCGGCMGSVDLSEIYHWNGWMGNLLQLLCFLRDIKPYQYDHHRAQYLMHNSLSQIHRKTGSWLREQGIRIVREVFDKFTLLALSPNPCKTAKSRLLYISSFIF
jgi:hypothetical protein